VTIQDQEGPTKLGSQLALKLTLTNTSKDKITIRDRNRWCDYELEVRDVGGQQVPETTYKRDLKCGNRL
jgi:hypothetical protein